jgi:hypothetical protein
MSTQQAAEIAYWYDLSVEIEPTDVGVLVDALEDEPFALRELLGARELERRIRSRELVVRERVTERWDGFDRDLEVLSIYLSQYIVGRELVLRGTRGAPVVTGWKVVACRGEVVRLDLDVLWDHRTKEVVDHGENLEAIAERWSSLPEWLRASLRISHPSLRAL